MLHDEAAQSYRPIGEAADHVRLYAWLMNSQAWKALTPVARALYLLLKALYKGNNNGRLVLSVRQVADELHISKTTAANAFSELQVHGFIEAMIRGSFGGRKDRRATEWLLTEHKCDVTGICPRSASCAGPPEAISQSA